MYDQDSPSGIFRMFIIDSYYNRHVGIGYTMEAQWRHGGGGDHIVAPPFRPLI
jgi:hypothetical protein